MDKPHRDSEGSITQPSTIPPSSVRDKSHRAAHDRPRAARDRPESTGLDALGAEALREWYVRHLKSMKVPLFGYYWVLETKNGGRHYHVVFLLPHGTQLPAPTQRSTRGKKSWTHGCAWVEPVRSLGRITNYLSKTDTKLESPKYGRLFGLGGTNTVWKRKVVWQSLPQWLRDAVLHPQRMRRAPGGGYYSLITGEIFRSPWKCLFVREAVRWKLTFVPA
jgi:hypothetical protein